jgi:hypothetical protein
MFYRSGLREKRGQGIRGQKGYSEVKEMEETHRGFHSMNYANEGRKLRLKTGELGDGQI